MLIWVNDIQKSVTAKFGTEVNLLDEDMNAGYDDYILHRDFRVRYT